MRLLTLFATLDMTSEHQLYLGLVIVISIAFIAYLLRDRITKFFVKTRHGKIGIEADKPAQPRPDLRAQNVTANRDANVIDELGGTIDAKGIRAGQDATISRKGPPKQ
jgi:hypothetical protein